MRPGWGRDARRGLLLDLPLTHVASMADVLDVVKTAGGGTATFAWEDGDGNNPTLGPSMTSSGTPSSGQPTPWELVGGAGLTCEEYDGSSYRATSDTVDPATGDDIVIALLLRTHQTNPSTAYYLATRRAAAGWQIYTNASNQIGTRVSDGVSNAYSMAGGINCNQWLFYLLVADRDGNMQHWLNGSGPSGVVAMLSTDVASGTGLGLAATDSGAAIVPAGGAIAWTAIWYGEGIADVWLADSYDLVERVSAMVLGYQPRTGRRPSFSRASAAAWQDSGGTWQLATAHLPGAGDSYGLRASPARTNLCYNTINPQATTGWSATETTLSTLQVVDDSTALGTDLAMFGPNVIEYANASGATQYLQCGAATGSTSAHSISAWARITAGLSATLGLYDGVTFTIGASLGTSMTRVKAHGVTPGSVNQTWAIEVPDGVTVRVVMPQLEAGSRVSSPIPNWATAATAARSADVLDTEVEPRNAGGKVQCGIRPLGWADTEAGDALIIDRTTGPAELIRADALGGLATDDGTTVVRDTSTALADGSRVVAAVDWGPSLDLTVEGTRTTGAYDGALQGSGDVAVPADLDVAVDSIEIWRRP